MAKKDELTEHNKIIDNITDFNLRCQAKLALKVKAIEEKEQRRSKSEFEHITEAYWGAKSAYEHELLQAIEVVTEKWKDKLYTTKQAFDEAMKRKHQEANEKKKVLKTRVAKKSK